MSIVDETGMAPATTNGHNVDCVNDVVIPVPWGHLSGKWWGPMDQQPIVAIHGWQDNAGTFDTLIRLLPSNVAVLAIDLPGHGLSTHLPTGQYYYIFWDGLLALRRVINYYKWNKTLTGTRPTVIDWNLMFTHFPIIDIYNAIIELQISKYRCITVDRKWWGPKGIQPIVALHGRQDNAGSFDNLIPLLNDDISILCLDMPGHGLSSHYPKSQYYYVYWDGIILLRRIVKHFKWKKVKLLGHSLGGAISFLYAASYPDEVDFIISLDIAGPSVKDVTKSPAQTGGMIDKFLKYEDMKPDKIPSYTYEEVLDIVEHAYGGSITKEGAEILMKRGLRASLEPDRFYFSRDPRLKVSGMGMVSMDLVLAYAARIKCGYLNIRAVPGLKLDHPESYGKILDQIKVGAKKFEYHEVEGTHHVHLNNPERLAPIINNFLST